MKLVYFFLFVVLFFTGCASTSKKNVEFVPIQISWDLLNDLDSEDPLISSCMVQLTNQLMEHENIQKYAGKQISFLATVSEEKQKERMLSFLGTCPKDAAITDAAICDWKASCNSEGKIEKIHFFSDTIEK